MCTFDTRFWILVFFPSTFCWGSPFLWSWVISSSLLDFLFSDPLRAPEVVVIVVVVLYPFVVLTPLLFWRVNYFKYVSGTKILTLSVFYKTLEKLFFSIFDFSFTEKDPRTFWWIPRERTHQGASSGTHSGFPGPSKWWVFYVWTQKNYQFFVQYFGCLPLICWSFSRCF